MGRTMTPFLSEPARAALGRLASGESRDRVPDPLTRIADIRSLIAALETEPSVLDSVREALVQDVTWDEIAAAAHLKAPAAKWRWAGTDAEIAARLEAGRKRAARPSNVPTDLPGYSVAEAARRLGVTAQAIYLRVSRGQLRSQTVELDDGRKYKRVFLNDPE